MYVKKTLNPRQRKSSGTYSKEIIRADINPTNAVHKKFELIYGSKRITAADDDEFHTMLNQILLLQHECIVICNFNLPNIDWTLQRPTPAPGNKLMQLVAENNLTQHVHESTRQTIILDLVLSTEEELILNLKITDKIGVPI